METEKIFHLRGKLPLVSCLVTQQKKLAYLTWEGNGKTSIQNKNPTGYPLPHTTQSEVYLHYQVGAVCLPASYIQEAHFLAWNHGREHDDPHLLPVLLTGLQHAFSKSTCSWIKGFFWAIARNCHYFLRVLNRLFEIGSCYGLARTCTMEHFLS